jgi:hypothetical protein
MPSVDVVTGDVTNGPIMDGEEFQWTCSEDRGTVYVTAQLTPGGKPWFTPSGSDTSFTAPSGSFTVTAQEVSPIAGWSYTANVNTDNAKIRVDSSMPGRHAKAS